MVEDGREEATSKHRSRNSPVHPDLHLTHKEGEDQADFRPVIGNNNKVIHVIHTHSQSFFLTHVLMVALTQTQKQAV